MDGFKISSIRDLWYQAHFIRYGVKKIEREKLIEHPHILIWSFNLETITIIKTILMGVDSLSGPNPLLSTITCFFKLLP